ncbi:MAG: TatD family hydrolase [Candidatus Paceibacterota bacterium]
MLSSFDIHAHLNFPDFDADRESLITKLAEAGIGVINIGTDLKTSEEVVSLAGRYDHLWAAVGIHPHEAGQLGDISFDRLATLAALPKVVAIGECGLDLFRPADREQQAGQEALFIKQIELARTVGKPLMLHVREAYSEVLAILDRYPDVRCHAHFFAGDLDIARRFLDRGDSLSFTGVITFADQYDEVIKQVPLDRLLAETDSPYVAPAPHRGRRNDPANVRLVAERIAHLRPEPSEVVLTALRDNALRIFNLTDFARH